MKSQQESIVIRAYFTSDKRITSEVARIFSFLETVKLPSEEFKHLLVGQFNLRKTLIQLIDFEIAEASAGRAASIILKINSLQDEEMIEKLYVASQAGVKIELNIQRYLFPDRRQEKPE